MNRQQKLRQSLNQAVKMSIVASSIMLALTGCKQEGRVTTNSPDLTGLWRMTVDSNQSGVNLELGFTSTIRDNGNTVVMRSCVERVDETLNRQGSILSPSPNGDITITNNDNMSANGDLGPVKFQKMSVKPQFDLSSLAIQTSGIVPVSSDEVCTSSVVAKIVGMSALETFTVYTPYQGSVLGIEMSKVSKFSAGEYSVGPVDATVTIAMESPAFQSPFGNSRIDLKEGTLTVTERSAVWFKGNFDAQLPNGVPISAQFELELP